jgi:hypothetical protein
MMSPRCVVCIAALIAMSSVGWARAWVEFQPSPVSPT